MHLKTVSRTTGFKTTNNGVFISCDSLPGKYKYCLGNTGINKLVLAIIHWLSAPLKVCLPRLQV